MTDATAEAPRPPRTPEEEAAGNRRALIGCGLISVVLIGIVAGLIYMFRMSGGGDGVVCEQKSDCKPGHECVGDVFKAVKSVCRKTCETNADCPVGTCSGKILRDGGKVCQ